MKSVKSTGSLDDQSLKQGSDIQEVGSVRTKETTLKERS